MFRFTFPETDKSYVIVDAFDRGSYIKIIPEENKIIGYTTRNSGGVPENFKNYFVVVFDKPFTYKATVGDSEIRKGETEAQENHTGAIIGFLNPVAGRLFMPVSLLLLSVPNRLS